MLAIDAIDALTWGVIVTSSVAVFGMAAFLGHGAWSAWAARRAKARLEPTRSALEAALAGTATAAHRSTLTALPMRRRIEFLTSVAATLAGAPRARLTALAEELGITSAAERSCRSRRWWRRLYGVRQLTLLGGGANTVPRLLTDPRAEVRAQAAQWVVEHHDEALIDALLQMLEADEGATRFAVRDSLIRIGRPLLGRLVPHLSERSGPSLAPALEVAVALADPVLLPVARARRHDPDPGVRALAAELAGAIGGPTTVETLLALVDDDVPEVRAATARAMGRAGHWSCVAALAPMLGDRSWDVRRQAAVALRSLGSPGALFLRQALTSADPYAADAARHMLDLPDSAVRTL